MCVDIFHMKAATFVADTLCTETNKAESQELCLSRFYRQAIIHMKISDDLARCAKHICI